MFRRVCLARFVAVAAIVPFAFAHPAPVSAQEPSQEAFYRKLDPKQSFEYKWKGKVATANAGVFRWEVPESQFGTNGLDRNFAGYCAEILVPIEAEKTYTFRSGSLAVPSNYGVQEHPSADRVAARRAKLIRELFGRHYKDPLRGIDSDEAAAFQIALWEITQETEPVEGEAKLDLFGGDFQSAAPRESATPATLLAQRYLSSLTGDDALYFENPNLRGRELIRLQGLPNAAGVTAQSQYALRFTGGGAVGGTGPSLALGGGSVGGGLPLSGGTAGGFGGGAGGGGLVSSGNNGTGTPAGASTFPTVTPTTTVPVGGSSTTSPPGNTSVTTPPVGGPDNTTPVPVPAGLLLGGIALGTLGTWRLGAKLLATK